VCVVLEQAKVAFGWRLPTGGASIFNSVRRAMCVIKIWRVGSTYLPDESYMAHISRSTRQRQKNLDIE
jgi:hypothetical protein